MKVGIFFGGPSREREISFAGGRTVYDNLDKSLFEAVPIFIDSNKKMALLNWDLLYKGTIRDFYPPILALPDSPNNFQIYIESLKELDDSTYLNILSQIGQPITWEDLPHHIDFAFLALHGSFGEDGKIQAILESMRIPYSGSGIRACSIGIDKAFQKKMMDAGGFNTPKVVSIKRKSWLNAASSKKHEVVHIASKKLNWPIVVRPANQGSSIGVRIIFEEDVIALSQAIDQAFFIKKLEKDYWVALSPEEKTQEIRDLTDIRIGVGFPLIIKETGDTIYHPEALLSFLNHFFLQNDSIHLASKENEREVILEEYLKGKEFSCVVIKDENGKPIALPPTEIIKGGEVFDYRSKYLAGLSRKETPIRLSDQQIESIRKECQRLLSFFEFGTYARIDGFFTEEGGIFLNDPNTTSGMLPSSFFFHQAAEIGLNPSQFLTYIIRASLIERINESNFAANYNALLHDLSERILKESENPKDKLRIAVILGGYSSERHISVESGRNIFEKLSSSAKYAPFPVFLTGNSSDHKMFHIPVNLMLKDNADDIKDKINAYKRHPIIEKIKKEAKSITDFYAGRSAIFEPKELKPQDLVNQADEVFIALHGRPGEDGHLQSQLQPLGLPFNGSDSKSSQLTINKYNTLQTLRKAGFIVTEQKLIHKEDFQAKPDEIIENLEGTLPYPLIGKPVDDGCSSAVKLIHNKKELKAFLSGLFRDSEYLTTQQEQTLKLKPKEEFPRKNVALMEALITKNDAKHFLEITGGLLTHYKDGKLQYEIFEPSEALASEEILSLEEKFLAGEGQNITPARFSLTGDAEEHRRISAEVRKSFQKAAEVLGVTGYARIDAFVRIHHDDSVETIIIEVNSLPGMTPATCIFHQASLNGYKPYDFIDKILNFGLEKMQKLQP